jgi:hypothetical protein
VVVGHVCGGWVPAGYHRWCGVHPSALRVVMLQAPTALGFLFVKCGWNGVC